MRSVLLAATPAAWGLSTYDWTSRRGYPQEASQADILEFAPEVGGKLREEEAQNVLRELQIHVDRGGGLSWFAMLFRPRWRELIRASRINGIAPRTSAHFRALKSQLVLDAGRKLMGLRWARQAEPAGLPAFTDCGPPPEPVALDYAAHFEPLLGWWPAQWAIIAAAMREAGFKWEEFRKQAVAKGGGALPFERDSELVSGPLRNVIVSRLAYARGREATIRLAALEMLIERYRGPRCAALLRAIRSKDLPGFGLAREALMDLHAKSALWARRRAHLDRLAKVAPEWAAAVSGRVHPHDRAMMPGNVVEAWKWKQLSQEIGRRAELDERKLSTRLHQRRAELRECTAELIDRKAWLGQLRRIKLPAQMALQGWAQIQRKIGKGTGKRVPALRAEARRLLSRARDAVPVWIMPLNRVADAFDPAEDKFDVVIVDEASQADPRGLLCWFLGKQVAVVGDHEQVSPLAVGQQIEPVQALINEHLGPVPNKLLYGGTTSIYDLARTCFGGAIALREHFRCVPEIIEYSNQLSYQGEIRPLRNPASAPRPHVAEYVVTGEPRGRVGKTNVSEARVLAAIVRATTEMTEFDGKTIGAIALLGDEQPALIQELTLQLVSAEELERRRFIAGNPAQFQGDERDVILLSMVDSPSDRPLRMTQADLFKQRYNVAASRAKDQMWLIHSLDPGRDLQPGDLRRGLIEHVRNPMARQMAIVAAQRRAESPLETEVIGRLMRAGYRVKPQVWVGRYRIDMVVSDDKHQVALECDGDRFHGVDHIPHDMARQAILERAGWTFIRVRGTRFFRDKVGTIAWVMEELTRAGIQPTPPTPPPEESQKPGEELREKVVGRAQEIMRGYGWLPGAAQVERREEES